ncbi:MAG: tripartite tricarboxylate transporter TctB family protein [Actinomycetes bacterium]
MTVHEDAAAPPVASHPERELGLLVVAGVLAAIAAMLIYGNLTMRVSGTPGAFGPQTMPWITAVLCLLASALLVVTTFRHPGRGAVELDPMTARATVHDPFDETFAPTVLAEQQAEIGADPGTNWRGLALGVGALVLFAVILEPLGWLISATVLFFLMAYALDGRRYLAMALAGLGLASLIQVVFSGLLGMTLPSGILGG